MVVTVEWSGVRFALGGLLLGAPGGVTATAQACGGGVSHVKPKPPHPKPKPPHPKPKPGDILHHRRKGVVQAETPVNHLGRGSLPRLGC